MVSKISVLAIDANDPEAIARFWCGVLGWSERGREDGVIEIGPGDGGPGIDIEPVPEAKSLKNRLHLDLRADGSTRNEELARLLELGARRVDIGQGPDATWDVLADPEGNEFCLLSRTVQEASGAAG